MCSLLFEDKPAKLQFINRGQTLIKKIGVSRFAVHRFAVMKKCGGLTDFGSAGKTGTFNHGKNVGCDVAIYNGVVIEVAAGAVYITIYAAVYMHLTGANIALDVGKFADGHFAGLGEDFALYLSVNVHIILEGDGADNLNTLCQYVGCVAHNV